MPLTNRTVVNKLQAVAVQYLWGTTENSSVDVLPSNHRSRTASHLHLPHFFLVQLTVAAVQPRLEESELEKAAELQKGRSAVAIVATRCFRTAAKIGWLSLWVAAVASPQEEPWNGVCDTIFAVIHYFLYSMRDYIVIYKGSKRYIARVCRQFLFEIFFLSLSAKAKEDSFLLGADPTSARHVSLWPGQVRLISLELLCSSWRRGIPV